MIRCTDEAAALLANSAAPHSLARWYAERVRKYNHVTLYDVRRVYTAFRMMWEWEEYCAAVYAGNPKAAYECSRTEGVLFGSTMLDNPSDADIPEWIRFLDEIHGDCDWWSLLDDVDIDDD